MHPGLRVGTGGPDVFEGPAATVGDPEAGVLGVPGVAIAQPAETAPFARNPGAVPAVQADIIQHGLCAGHPFHADGAGIDRTRVDADARDDIGPTLRGLDNRLRLARSLKRGGLVRQIDHRGRRMEADQHGVRPECQRVADAVPSHRQIERPVFRNRLFEGRRVVSLAVAGDAQRPDVDPGGGVGKTRDIRFHRRGQGRHLVGRQGGLDLPIRAQAGDVQPVGEPLDHVGRSGPGDGLSALAEAGQDRHVLAGDVLQVDLGPGAVFVADDQRRPRDVLQTSVAEPKLLRVVGDD